MLRKWFSTICWFIILGLISACYPAPAITSTTERTPIETENSSPTPASPTLRKIGSLGMGSADDIAWTPDGNSLVIAGSQGLHFYNPQSWQLQNYFETPTELQYGYPNSVSISQDGTKVLFVGTGGIWQTDIKNGQTTRILRDAIYSDARALYSLDRKRIAFLRYTIAVDGFASYYSLEILSTNDQKILATLIEESTTEIYTVKLSPDGHTLAAARADNLIYLFDINTGEPIGTLTGHESDVLDIDFSPDGKHLASIGADATLRIWDVNTKQVVQTLRDFEKSMRAVEYTSNDSLLGLIPDGQIEHWTLDVQGRASAQSTIFRTDDLIQRMVVQPGGNLLALLGETNQIQVLDLNTGKVAQRFSEFGESLDKLTWSKSGDQVAAVTEDWQHATIFVWETSTRKLLHRYELDTGSVTDLAFSPDGKMLVAVDRGRFIRFWDLTANYDSLRIKSASGDVGRMGFSPDGRYLAIASRTLQVWKLDKGETDYHVVHEAEISGEPLSVAYSPDGNTIAVVTQKEVTTWDADFGKLLSTWQTGNNNFYNAQVYWEAGLGRVVLTLSWNGAFFHNLNDGALLYSMPSTESSFSPFVVDSDKRLLVIGDYKPRIVDVLSGSLLWSDVDQKLYWDKLALRSDGLMLATSDYGNTIHLWDMSGLLSGCGPVACCDIYDASCACPNAYSYTNPT
ncbi:MAG: WD40 repeat domain-containing protein [Anaerolineales bacterium]